jgi:hypothetical protein
MTSRNLSAKKTASKPSVKAKRLESQFQHNWRLGSGLKDDLGRRLPLYFSDFADGWNLRSISSIFFLSFTTLVAAIVFGGLTAQLTGNAIGVTEMLLATAVCGMLYALGAGQPLTLIGGTGSFVVCSAIIFNFCQSQGLPFLPIYSWIGLWTMAFLIGLSLFNASVLTHYLTRFTYEVFAAIISCYFIYEASIYIFGPISNPVTRGSENNLMSLILALGAFMVAWSLKNFRSSLFLKAVIRKSLANLGLPIAIVVMTAVAQFSPDFGLATLKAPETFGTSSGRPWLVDLLSISWSARFIAMGPALLVTFLIFFAHSNASQTLNKTIGSQSKGSGYHLDLFWIAIMIGACSLFGLPWIIAAAVPTLNHLRSLSDIKTTVKAGQRQENILRVRENRITGFVVHLLLLLSLLALPLLTLIPVSVLYGVLLYMGVVLLSEIQFVERLTLWIRDPKRYPRTHYLRNAPAVSTHLLTGIQLACFAAMWWYIKSDSPIMALLFPALLSLMVFLRVQLNSYFDPKHLQILDSEEGSPRHPEWWV